jgi:hypothetical protein
MASDEQNKDPAPASTETKPAAEGAPAEGAAPAPGAKPPVAAAKKDLEDVELDDIEVVDAKAFA